VLHAHHQDCSRKKIRRNTVQQATATVFGMPEQHAIFPFFSFPSLPHPCTYVLHVPMSSMYPTVTLSVYVQNHMHGACAPLYILEHALYILEHALYVARLPGIILQRLHSINSSAYPDSPSVSSRSLYPAHTSTWQALTLDTPAQAMRYTCACTHAIMHTCSACVCECGAHVSVF
jgi:hypothetical protein